MFFFKPKTVSPLSQIARFLLASLLLVNPLIFWLDFATVFTAPKLLYLRMVLALLSIIFFWQFSFERDFKIKLPAFAKNLLPWLTSLSLSTLFTVNIFTSLYGQFGRYTGYVTMVDFLWLAFLFWQYFERRDLFKLLLISSFAALLAAIYGIFQFYNFFGFFSWGVNWSDSPQSRIFGTVGHANHLGAYLAAHLLIIPYLQFPKLSRLLSAIVKFLGGAALLFALVLTASRGALLAFVVSLLLVLILFFKFTPKLSADKKRFKIIVTVAVLIVVFSVLAGAIVLFNSSFASDLGLVARNQQTISSLESGFVPERISFAFSAFDIFTHYPVFGSGLGTFRDIYNAFRRTDYLIDGSGNLQYFTVPEAAHNEYLNILATQGIFGLLAYLWIIFAAGKLILKNLSAYRNQPEQKILFALTGAFSVYLLQTVFNFGEIVNLTLFYFLIAAIGLFSESRQLAFKLSSLWRYLIFFLALFFTLLYCWYQIYDFGVAENNLKLAQNSEEQGLSGETTAHYLKAINALPNEYSLYQSLGDFTLRETDWVKTSVAKETLLNNAVSDYLAALRLNSSYASTAYNLSLAYFQLYGLTKDSKYLQLGKQSAWQAVQKGVNNPFYFYQYARDLHVFFNDPRSAIPYLKEALQMNPRYQEPQDYLNFIYKNYPSLR